MSYEDRVARPSNRRRDAIVAALIVATVVALVAWRMTAPAESAPPPSVTSTTTPTVEAPLPDGEHFVYVKEVMDDGLRVDVAILLSGEEARLAAIEDGVIGPDEDLPNDVYIRNAEVNVVDLNVAPDADLTVLVFDDNGAIVEEGIKLNELKVAFTGDYAGHVIYGLVAGEFPVTINVDNGVVANLEQVYLP